MEFCRRNVVSPTITVPSAPAVFIFDLILRAWPRLRPRHRRKGSTVVAIASPYVPLGKAHQFPACDGSVPSGKLRGHPSDQRIVAYQERCICFCPACPLLFVAGRL